MYVLRLLLEVLSFHAIFLLLMYGMIRTPRLTFASGFAFALIAFLIPSEGGAVNMRAWGGVVLLLVCIGGLLVQPRWGRTDVIRVFAAIGLHFLAVALAYKVVEPFGGARAARESVLALVVGVFLPLHLLRSLSPATRWCRHLDFCGCIRDVVATRSPLPEGLEAAGDNAPGSDKQRLRRMAHDVRKGKSLGEAILARYKTCPPCALGPMLGSEAMHRLEDGLAEAHSQLRRRAHVPQNRPSLAGVIYLLIALQFMLTTLLIIVAPKFHSVFAGMGVDLPDRFDWAWEIMIFVADMDRDIFLGLIGLVAGILAWQRFFPRGIWSGWPFSIVKQMILWHTPWVRRLSRLGQERRLIHHLVMGIKAGHDLPRILESAQFLQLHWVFARRLARWRRAIEAGEDPYTAAKQARLGRNIRCLFAHNRSPLRLCEVMEARLEQIRGRVDYTRQVLSAAFFPIVVIVAAIPVLALGVWLTGTLTVLLGSCMSGM